MTFLSIITVVRNDADGLRRTARSVLAQTDRDFEWLIVDGCSSDGTLELARQIERETERVTVASGRDKGIYDAMNKGLRAAKGEYLMFLNAGDAFEHEHVVEQVKAAVADRPCDILFGSSTLQFGSKQIMRHVKRPSYLAHGQPALHQGTIYRTKMHQKYEYDLGFRVCADYDCLCRMARDGAHMESAQILISRNEIAPDSQSTRYKTIMLKECFAIQRDILGLALPRRLISAARRGFNGVVAKGLAVALHRSAL